MAAEHFTINVVPRKKTRRPSKAVLERRALVAGMLTRRVTHGKIAKALGVSRPTIVKDVKAIEAEWRESMLESISTIKARELAELAAIEAEAWVGFNRTRRAGHRDPGDARWLKVILDVKKRRSDLLGLDAPIEIRHGLTEKDLRQMTDDELDQLEQQLASGMLH